ncbi:hypothetical protein [Asticcacaulis machinosus]|uniref:Phage shock protein B n=1 Tax=Asticcacaulis machinosus TaxID=2984211 RepID=A0ABT5HMK1_9CAUL|nr:hypothetical protein [Asticcacaulis machinosus]MDC7677243.1 hypothetical protein [Asticcacaulis machinosus]
MTDVFGVPITVVVTVIVHTAFVLLWVGRMSARIEATEKRLEQQAGLTERLARLEEQSLATRASLERIETKLDRGHL